MTGGWIVGRIVATCGSAHPVPVAYSVAYACTTGCGLRAGRHTDANARSHATSTCGRSLRRRCGHGFGRNRTGAEGRFWVSPLPAVSRW